MNSDSKQLSTSEMAVLESLHGETSAVSQREIARRTGLSVGLINAVIKKLVHTGYVKTARLNRKSIEYLLTPEGFAQTALRSYDYVLNTVRSFRAMRLRLSELINRLSSEGIEKFYLHGDGELADAVQLFFEEIGKGKLDRGLPDNGNANEVVLNAFPLNIEGKKYRVIDLVEELGNNKLPNNNYSESEKDVIKGLLKNY